MMNLSLTPVELAARLVDWGAEKKVLSGVRLVVLGALAGVYIGFAAHLATVVGTGDFAWIGLQKFFVGAVFSVGLMLVVIPGSELWTGNTMMTAAWLEKRLTLLDVLRNWCWVYLGNLLGSVFLAWLIVSQTGLMDGVFGGTALQIASNKVSEEFATTSHAGAYLFRAIACNWLVCLAVLLAMAAKDIAGKILGIFFPIMAFVAAGFEHVVANMYFIPAGIFAKALPAARDASGLDAELLAQLNWWTLWQNNLLVVTVGNLVGGGLCVAAVYWWLYIRSTKTKD
ncbi:MAG: formate/nitrite transporter family protein [Desulfuromonadales bacterium]|nr:formate/nitrite transporter family protein [Desulfuromonadales bacterium]